MMVRLLGNAMVVGESPPASARASIGVGKPLVLLARLVVEGRPISREAIGEFLWPNIPTLKSQASVRQALYLIRRAVGDQALEEQHGRVAVSPLVETDWRRVQAATQRRDDAAIVEGYGGAFLETVPVLDVQEVDQWIAFERARLQHLFARAALREVERLRQAGALRAAVDTAQKLRQLHPDEPAHWALLLGLLRELDDVDGVAAECLALAYRVSIGALNGTGRGREILAEYRAMAERGGAPVPVLALRDDEDDEDDED
ncbi:MAG: hypothetical protein KJT01_15730 [Gemmatimonadetes bacterium]|nr:hypothetical protein [Gemmatimonadota bacterium]